jgi:hypothetical protein
MMEKCVGGGNQRLVGRAVKKTELGREPGELSRRMQSAGPCIESLNCKGGRQLDKVTSPGSE